MRLFMRGTSPILVTAALSVAALIAAFGAELGSLFPAQPDRLPAAELEPVEPRAYLTISDHDENGNPDWYDELLATGIAPATTTVASPSDPLTTMADSVAAALYGNYLSLKQAGTYTAEQGTDLAYTIAANIRAERSGEPITVEDIVVRENSEEAVLEYRADLRIALAPMITEEPPELEYYAYYVSTKDPAWLTKLSDAAKRYQAAKENMLAVAAPKDSIPEHLRALNALSAYAEILERLSLNAPDTFAAVALLKSLNESETEMLTAFDALAKYYVRSIAQQ